MIGQGIFPRRDRWAAAQLDLHVPAKFDLAHSTHVGTVESLCSTGVSARFSSTPKVGSTGYLTFTDLSLYCSVAWADQDRCGLLFDRHLADRQMEQLAWIASNHDTYERTRLRTEARTWR